VSVFIGNFIFSLFVLFAAKSFLLNYENFFRIEGLLAAQLVALDFAASRFRQSPHKLDFRRRGNRT
jgi:hypothetical protein